jgi:hypothetical protein
LVDALAHRYGTDPLTVLDWDPLRISAALSCMRTHQAHAASMIERTARHGMVFPAVILGGG